MFCKITKSKVEAHNVKQVEQWFKEKWGPLISGQPGFIRYYYVLKSDGEFAVIMLWETEENVQSWTDNPQHQALVPELKSLLVSPLMMDIYKVIDSGQR